MFNNLGCGHHHIINLPSLFLNSHYSSGEPRGVTGSNFEMKPERRRMPGFGLHFEVRAGSRRVECARRPKFEFCHCAPFTSPSHPSNPWLSLCIPYLTAADGGVGVVLGVWAALGNFGKMKPECRGILTDLASWVQGVQVGISLPTFMPCPLAYPGRETKLVLDIRDTPVFPTTSRNASELTVASPVGENPILLPPKTCFWV